MQRSSQPDLSTALASNLSALRLVARCVGSLLAVAPRLPARYYPRLGAERSRRPLERFAEEWVQLATRIPKELHRRLKLHCVEADLSLQDFLTRALREKLDREARRHRKGHA